MVRKEMVKVVEDLRGGRGIAQIHNIVTEEELNGHGSMYARVVLKPGSSIGYHRHIGNTEPYYILKGEGIFTDNDGTKTVVKPGDCCIIECGQSHGIENASEFEDLEFMALVYNDKENKN